jgi:hypothetical protein
MGSPHLHRVEGDLDNTGYSYRQACRPPTTGDLATEWATIAATLLVSKRFWSGLAGLADEGKPHQARELPAPV